MDLLIALHFLTTLPVPLPPDLPKDAWGKSMAYFPLVGLVIGLLLVVGEWIFSALWAPGVVAALLLTEWVMLTGALHLDGFIDCCDALLASKTPEERLAILRDPHVGSFGLVGAIVLLLTKYAALTVAVAAEQATIPALVLAPILGRWAMVYAAVRYPYARPGPSLGAGFARFTRRSTLWIASLAALALAVVAGGWAGLVALLLAWAIVALVASWTMGRIPGLTGDVYGAINELVELCELLLVILIFHR